MKPSALKVGIDVPWVTSWTAEPIIGVRPCPSVSGRAALVQTEAAGFGKPEYSKNHLLRQRLSVTRMLCPMCGQPTHADDRWTQVARRIPAGLLRRQGRGEGLPPTIADRDILLDAGAIAPLHRRCSDMSLKHCPHLRADPNVNVLPFPARWAVTPLMIEASPPVGGAPLAVVTFMQLCGITGKQDAEWKLHTARYRPRTIA